MSEPLPDLDLKFLPEWLKEGVKENRYADYRGEPEDDRRRDGGAGRGGPRGDRPGGGRGARPPGGGGARREGGGPPRGDRGPRPGGRPGGDRRDGPQRGRDREERPRPAAPPAPPIEVKIEFFPEPNGAVGIAKQIRSSGRAYPLFGTGRLFLDRPERHRVRITSVDPTIPLYQIADGPISPDRAAIERNAFRDVRDQFYKEEVVQGEPIKGNFTNVARVRTGGQLLGPTNYHAYQPALRRLFDERFSRRMSFPEFLGQEIQILTDEQSINDWKEQARSTTTYVTTQEAEPLTFKTAFEAEQHFRQHYLPALVKSGYMLECSGTSSRRLPDRSITEAVRDSWEREYPFPQQIVNNLRPFLVEAGLHFFKHRKRVLYVATVRPARHASGQDFAPGIAAILNTVEATPRCTRRDLALKILGAQHDAPEAEEQKAALARDLHYLIHQGNVIEFHDGTLDLPLIPGAQPQQQPQHGKTRGPVRATGASVETVSPEESLQAESASVTELPLEGDLTPSETSDAEAPIVVDSPVASDDVMSIEGGTLDGAEELPGNVEMSASASELEPPLAATPIPGSEPIAELQSTSAVGPDASHEVVGAWEEDAGAAGSLSGSEVFADDSSASAETTPAEPMLTAATPEEDAGAVSHSLAESDAPPTHDLSAPPLSSEDTAKDVPL